MTSRPLKVRAKTIAIAVIASLLGFAFAALVLAGIHLGAAGAPIPAAALTLPNAAYQPAAPASGSANTSAPNGAPSSAPSDNAPLAPAPAQHVAASAEPEPAAPAATDAAARAPLILIDPGHGGSNTGAPAAAAASAAADADSARVRTGGLREKHVTLAIARQLWDILDARGYRVLLTRDRDVYLTLRQRVRMANRLGADLFISVHTNASPSHNRRGYETFLLPPHALDIDSRALRLEDGAIRPGLERETALLLDDLERGAAQTGAAELASAIQDRLRALRGPEFDRGVRQSAMDVLFGATMPAVLCELGFLDHPVEGPELADPALQRKLAEALADAIGDVLPLTDDKTGPGDDSRASAQ